MSKVIQIRGVPDDVHRRLVEAAESAGKSLTSFLNVELSLIARRADLAWHNRVVLEELRAELGAPRGSHEETRRAIDQGRAERGKRLAKVRREK